MRSRIVRFAGIGLLVVVCLSALRFFNGDGQARASSTARVYWGAFMGGSVYGSGYGDAPYDLRTWNLFESHAGKHVSILHFTQPWNNNGNWQSFPTQEFNTIRQRGAIPLLSWGSWDACCGPNESAFALRNIANGAHSSYRGKTFDQYVTAWAKAAKNWGHPFFLRFDHEMNGWWQFPWATAPDPKTGVTINNNKPADYVAAWKHVHDIFTSVGTTNVTWVWSPNIESHLTTPIASVYPGSGYVDWTGLDGYNNSVSNWLTFSQIFSGSKTDGFLNSYVNITTLAPTKPLMLAEWASLEANDGGIKKAAWETDALTTQVLTNYTKIKAIVWYNAPGLTRNSAPYQIESTLKAQTAFATAIASSYYATNSFGSLNTSPIPALS